MEHRGQETVISPTERTVPIDAERTIASPRFDEKSIQRAQPAVPLTLRGRARSWPLAAVVVCVVGGIVGGVLGGLAITFYQRDGSHATTQASAARQDSGDAVIGTSSTDAGRAPQSASQEQKQPDVNASAQPSTMNVGTQPSAVNAGVQPTVGQSNAASAGAARNSAPAVANEESAVAAVEADAGTQGELRAALGEWLAATNSRDVQRQMKFYAPTVDAFYLSRNASREAVRAEKSRVFAQADSVNVQAATPEIHLSRDGRTAIMRFRKSYKITGGEGSRSGEVLQELRWHRTPGGWKIVSERDLRVLQ
jgi:ketosteroid isomerase-like protein